MDWDLNREPAQALEEESLGHLLVELEDYHGRIEERIRQLESVVTRARDRLSSQYSSPPNTWNLISSSSTSSNRGDGTKPCKMDGGAHLLAEALAIDPPCQKKVNFSSTLSSPSALHCRTGGSLFDCNICFNIAKNPVLTCCGHLFCWPCFYCLPNSDSDSSKECPVCQGEVLDADITPIYGTASDSNVKDQPGFKVPPRPRGRRIPTLLHSPNHQRVTQIFRAAPSLPTQERIRQLSVRVHPSWHSQSSTNTLASPSQVADNPPIQPHRFSRLSFEAGSLLGPPSAMSQIHPLSSHEYGDSVRSYDPILDAGGGMNSIAPHYSLANAHSGIQVTDGSNSYQTTGQRSSSSRRRTSTGIGIVRSQRRRRGDGFSG